jgi:hypothetical protein
MKEDFYNENFSNNNKYIEVFGFQPFEIQGKEYKFTSIMNLITEQQEHFENYYDKYNQVNDDEIKEICIIGDVKYYKHLQNENQELTFLIAYELKLINTQIYKLEKTNEKMIALQAEYKFNDTSIYVGVRQDFMASLDALLLDVQSTKLANNDNAIKVVDDFNTNQTKTSVEALTKKVHFLNGGCTPEQINFLSSSFQNINMIQGNTVVHGHPLYSNSRILNEITIVSELGDRLPVFDIGGAYDRHYGKGRLHIHSCFKISTVEEESRAIDITLRLLNNMKRKYDLVGHDEISNEFLKKDESALETINTAIRSGTDNMFFCNNSATVCPHRPKKGLSLGMSIQSLFDIHPFELAQIQINKKIIKAIHVLSVPREALYQDEGILMFNSGTWKVSEGFLYMNFNDTNHVYKNSYENVMLYLKKRLYILGEYGLYIKIDGYRGTDLIIQTFLLNKTILVEKLLDSAIWLTPSVKETVYRIPILNPNLPAKLINHKLNINSLNQKDNLEVLQLNENEKFYKSVYEDVKEDVAIEMFVYEDILVNEDLKNLLVTRLMGDAAMNITNLWNSLLEFARGLKFQTEIRKVSSFHRYVEDPKLITKHAIIAFMEHHRLLEQLNPLVKMAGKQRNQDFTGALKTSIKNFIISTISLFDPSDLDIVQSFLNTYKDVQLGIDILDSEHLPNFDDLNIQFTNKCNSIIINSEVEIRESFLNQSSDINLECLLKHANMDVFHVKDLIRQETEQIKSIPSHNCDHYCHGGHDSNLNTKNKQKCDCCGLIGYIKIIKNKKLCVCCRQIQTCENTSNCTGDHKFPNEHCCFRTVCFCIKNVKCECCTKPSISSPCPFCNLNGCIVRKENENKHEKEDKEKKNDYEPKLREDHSEIDETEHEPKLSGDNKKKKTTINAEPSKPSKTPTKETNNEFDIPKDEELPEWTEDSFGKFSNLSEFAENVKKLKKKN